MKLLLCSILLCSGIASLAGAQNADTDRSVFTEMEICESRDPGNLAPYLDVCEGPAGLELWFGFSEHSSIMAVGPNGIEQQFEQRPPVAGLDMLIGPVFDWRYAEGAQRPYALIVRYTGLTPIYDQNTGDYTGDERTDSNLLVVIALRYDGPVSGCHIAYMDAMQLPHVNRRAHYLAAEHAADFRCGVDDVRYIDADNSWD